MINSERHETAERLRILANHAPTDAELVNDLLGLYPGEYIDGYDPCNIQHLADLIEPEPERICKFRNDGHGILRCDSEECDFGMDYHFPIPNYCPNCGAKVVK